MPEPPALRRVKSPARLATSSGGLVIVHVRLSGEPARTSRSAQGLPSPGLDPARCRWSSSVMRTTQRSVVPNERGKLRSGADRLSPGGRPRHVPTAPTLAIPPHRPSAPEPPAPHHHQQSINTTIRLLHTCGIRGNTGVADGDNAALDCCWRREPRAHCQAKQWGSAAAVADGTIGAWRTDLMTCRLVQR